MMTKPLIQLSNIKRTYGHGDAMVKALDGVSLEIYRGEFVAIMGQSGSGKSTLMNIIGMLDRATDGDYAVLGSDVSSLSPDELAGLRRDTFGFIFQRYNLLSTANAEENVEIPALYAGMRAHDRKKRAQELLENLGLAGRTTHHPNELSGGQQQRVAVARALMNNPPIILADEPTGALDSKSSEDVMALLQELHQQGHTVIVITHEEDVAQFAERQIRLEDGKIVRDDGANTERSDTLKASSKHEEDTTMALAMEGMESVKMALRSLRANLFRTALTLLGIVIGVAAVITMLAIGEGSKQNVLNQISSMGTNLLNVRPGAPGVRPSGNMATLVAGDAQAILDEVSNVAFVVPSRSSNQTIRRGNVDNSVSIEGVGYSFPQARDWGLLSGSFFTQKDQQSYAAVAVIGTSVAEAFFPYDEDPLGQFILVGNIPFEVIGVMESKGSAPWGSDQDNTVWVPYTTGLVRLFGSNYLSGITVKVADVDQVDQTQSDIEELLKARHQAEDFSVRSTTSFLEMATETQNTLTVLLGAVAAISLVVGGIGVMNIMLVSVVERTKEIGVRMATGARRRDILLQFNIEAAVVCTIGGIIGVLLGLAAGSTLSLFGVNIAFTLAPSVLAFGCAVGTGLLFGYLPARKAAQLDPVVALSSE